MAIRDTLLTPPRAFIASAIAAIGKAFKWRKKVLNTKDFIFFGW